MSYADESGLMWIKDDSNEDDRFDRNFMRMHIFPYLQQRWPQFSDAATRSAQLCAEQEALLDLLLEDTLATLLLPYGALPIQPLIPLSATLRWALLRRWLASQGVSMPSRQQLHHLWQDVALSRRDAMPQFIFDTLQLRRFRSLLSILPANYTSAVPVANQQLPWTTSAEWLPLPQYLGFLMRKLVRAEQYMQQAQAISHFQARQYTPVSVICAPQEYEHVSVRFGSVCGLLHINGRCHGRTLKKLWQELAVPPWQRIRMPLIFYNKTLIASPGLFVTRDGEAQGDCAQWMLYWLQSPSPLQGNSLRESYVTDRPQQLYCLPY